MISHEHLAVKIALLSLVNDLPEQPSIAKLSLAEELTGTGASRSQDLSCDPYGITSQRMPLKYELLAAQNLAFISAYSNDPLHVLALACHETHEQSTGSRIDGYLCGHKIIIRLAANSGTHDGLLTQMKKFAEILQDEANVIKRDSNGERLLLEVVRLNHKRILSRLRSRHARYYGAGNSTPLYKRLETARKLLYKVIKTSNTSTKQLEQRTGSLISQMIEIEYLETAKARSPKSENRILKLIRDVHEFMQHHEKVILRVPPNPGNWNKEATDSLLDRFRKLAKYVDSCEELLRTARRSRSFTRITVDFINLQETKSPIPDSTNANTTDGIITQSCTKRTLVGAAAYLRSTERATRSRIHNILREECRLHAEMQLVKFYERFPPNQRPRVIWSTKNACFLCHTFLKAYGRYYLPSTHGKLYRKWRYPLQTTSSKENNGVGYHADNLQELSLKFSRIIDRKLQDCLQRKIVPRRSNCAESKVDLLAVLTPSILSKQSQRSNDCKDTVATVVEAKSPGIPASASGDEFLHADDNNSISTLNSIDEIPIEERQANAPDNSIADTAGELTVDTFPKNELLVPADRCRMLESQNAQVIASDAKYLSNEIETHNVESPVYNGGRNFQLLKMQHGDVASHVFSICGNNDNNDSNNNNKGNKEDSQDKILRIHAPDIHVTLQHCDPPANTRLNNGSIDMEMPKERIKEQIFLLHIEISCLSLSHEESSMRTVFNLDDDDDDDDDMNYNDSLKGDQDEDEEHVEQERPGKESCLPRDILFSASGLRLKHKSTVLCFRAYTSSRRE